MDRITNGTGSSQPVANKEIDADLYDLRVGNITQEEYDARQKTKEEVWKSNK